MSSLWKIPMILSICISASLTYTPPTPRPDTKEKSKFGKDDTLTRLTESSWGPLIGNAVPWMLGMCEIAAVLASVYPSRSPESIAHVLLLKPSTLPTSFAVTAPFIVGWILAVSGAMLRSACYRYLGSQFTFELAVKDRHRLITSGPYRVVRHPSYTGFVCVSLGLVVSELCSGSWIRESGVLEHLLGQVLVGVWATYVICIQVVLLQRVAKEDQVLRAQFGEEWKAWFRRTPYALVPGVY
ncbi:hypothetical protein TRAPUB_13719 [Trametes pubescens]|uniref:Protein-S-isoprenylcysteine O-methyltransferase n=1 Tax=Trametes pubescens TaxID=154538 RepID=A0A1M2VQC9_TRAPU|nr:hypothetical protein TRAPUB_13719 [Trametes pubescens]